MANLRNAEIRARINLAFFDCIECREPLCKPACSEVVQCELDDIIDDMRKVFGGDAK